MFEISTNELKGGYDVRIIGYIGKFKNWRTLAPEDYDWIRLERAVETSVRDKVAAVEKKK
jgi:hypothetical protein